MKYKKKYFHIEGVSAEKIAKKYGTPTYCYSYNKIKSNIINFKNYFKTIDPLICFSVKSNNNLYILKEIKKLGLGADVVSQGELMKAIKAGINSKKIVFSGVGKTAEELKYAIKKNILLINSESESEVDQIERIAKSQKRIVNIGLRLNPNTDAKTIGKISTGRKEDKFGLTKNKFLNLVERCKKSKFLNLKCLSVHIGSQITSHTPYANMLKVVDEVINKSNYHFEFVDLGGGMGIKYNKFNKNLNYKKYNILIKKFLKKNKTKIIFEPGRSIVGNAGWIISRVIYIKKTNNKNFIIMDAAMNDLLRPALYGSTHNIIPSIKKFQYLSKNHEFVGPICESTDKFLNLKKFQTLNEKDLIIICDVGAYGMVLSSNYNLRTKPAEILVNKSLIKIISKRQKLNNII
tara:strand:- start:1081 stop:2295 length:1215 start_codon:yes stop_codon:yes gene_type:complete